MVDEIDLEKSNFRNFRKPVFLTFTLDRVDVTVMRICEVYRHTKLDRNRKKKLFVDVRTDGRTRTDDDLKIAPEEG